MSIKFLKLPTVEAVETITIEPNEKNSYTRGINEALESQVFSIKKVGKIEGADLYLDIFFDDEFLFFGNDPNVNVNHFYNLAVGNDTVKITDKPNFKGTVLLACADKNGKTVDIHQSVIDLF